MLARSRSNLSLKRTVRRIPYFDPCDGGINAAVLFLLEPLLALLPKLGAVVLVGRKAQNARSLVAETTSARIYASLPVLGTMTG